MASVNKVILVGHLGRDPETRYSADGNAIANFSLATSESWKDKQTGEKQERTEWHRCVAFNRVGEIVGEYLKKGAMVYVEGLLITRKWQDKDGQDRYTTEIRVDRLQMLGGRRDAGPDADADGQHSQVGKNAEHPSAPKAGGGKKPQGKFDDMDDDVPF